MLILKNVTGSVQAHFRVASQDETLSLIPSNALVRS